MSHSVSQDDRAFRDRVESAQFPAEEFDHRAHLRLAYIYLAGDDTEGACAQMRETLVRFLAAHGIDAGKYHETLTRAWIMAVHHFMRQSPGAPTADAFIDANPELMDTDIMLTHYSASVLFSDDARERFVEPDRSPIPPESND